MNRKTRAKSSSLFLIELIIALLFFAVISAVCVQIFVKSHLLSTDAKELSFAVSECSAAAELTSVSDDKRLLLKNLKSAYPDAIVISDAENTAATVYYDEKMQSSNKANAFYTMNIDIKQDDSMLYSNVSMSAPSDDIEIYSLNVKHHISQGDSDE